MEILRAYAHLYVQIMTHITTAMWELNRRDIWGEDSDPRMMLMKTMQSLRKLCRDEELPVTDVLTTKVIDAIEHGEIDPLARKYSDNVLFQNYLDQLKNGFLAELSTKFFFQLPANRRSYFDDPRAGWGKIINRFPDCLSDVEEMNRCFALSRYTASMFHALHVAEWGAIELGVQIGVTDPKRGWGPTTKKLREIVNAGHAKLSPEITLSFNFLEQMNREIETMVLAWRHKVDHAENRLAIIPNTILSSDIAEHIIQSVKVFMGRLEEGLMK